MKTLNIYVNGQPFEVAIETVKEYSGVNSASSNRSRPARRAPIAAPAARPVSAPKASAAAPVALEPVGPKDLASPMQGTVYKVKTSKGANVKAGEILVILEAMKMETPVKAKADGVVKEIKINESDVVTEGQLLVVVE